MCPGGGDKLSANRDESGWRLYVAAHTTSGSRELATRFPRLQGGTGRALPGWRNDLAMPRTKIRRSCRQPATNNAPVTCQNTCVEVIGSSLPYLLSQSIEERWSHERARPVSVAARQGRARRMGAPRQGRGGRCRTFAGRPSLGRRLDGQDARCLLHPGLPEGDGRGRRDAGSDRRRHLLRQPYCGRQRRLRVAVGAAAVLRPALRFGVGAHSGQRAVAHRADGAAQREICSDWIADDQRNGGHGGTGRG